MRRSLGVSLALVLFANCAQDATLPSDLRRQSSANSAASRSTIAVTSTDPIGTHQDTTLNVRVLGSGFTAGAKVSFAIKGVVSSKMNVNTTTYVSSAELVANVTVAADADTVKYDVITLMADGKKGIGSELFEILSNSPTATWYIPTTDPSLKVQSDGAFVSAGESVYAIDVCGILTRIFSSTDLSASGDATIQSNNPKTKAEGKRCSAYPRKLKLTYPDGASESAGFFAGVSRIASPTFRIAVGTTIARGFNIQAGARCGTLRFRTVKNDGTYIGADSVLVTRLDAQTYAVATQPYPNDRAYCETNGALYHMPLRLRIMSRDPLPE